MLIYISTRLRYILNIFEIIVSGVAPGQIYSYPAKRWKKKRRLFNVDYSVNRAGEAESGEGGVAYLII